MKAKKCLFFTVILAVAIIMFVMTFVIGYRAVDHMFPKAKPIDCPEIESITSASLTKDTDESTSIAGDDYAVFLKNIQEAKPTRTMSVNDYPAVESYYVIEIVSAEREYPYYIYLYEDAAEVFLEMPYEGIYKSNQEFYDFVATYFEEK